ncbi:MAG: type III-B CRISPR module RAMP protein Cmr6 [Planctomycetota bacterium]
MAIPLPQSIATLVAKHRGEAHPLLLLDKYVDGWEFGAASGKFSERVQKRAATDVARGCLNPLPGVDFAALSRRWQATLEALSAATFCCATTGPLTVHLTRTSVLENAGICLHPLYGFVYLPGSGLKGIAHAYSCEVWLPAQPDRSKAWDAVCRVFGWAASPWLRDLAARLHVTAPEAECRGSVVFHEAWPVCDTTRADKGWPGLLVDIVNNHHPNYYQAAPDDNAHPPGDWEHPNPVYFLAVQAGSTFRFALSARPGDATGAEDLGLAREWLLGALCHLGAGAKTGAGYGAFKSLEGAPPAVPASLQAVLQATVELVSPGFFAGASQEEADCDLRAATLRGLLRWWWRTLHAGFMDVRTLRMLEAALWGDTTAGGAVRLTVEPTEKRQPLPYSYKDRFQPRPDFKQHHGLVDPPDRKTTQGLFYLSYGMDEISHGERRSRYHLDAGAKWRVQLSARSTCFRPHREREQKSGGGHAGIAIRAADILKQAQAALWLLCTYGGVGSKERKGFGSLAIVSGAVAVDSLARCREVGAELRGALGLGNSFDEKRAHSSALGPEGWALTAEVPTPLRDPWQVLDIAGFAYQAYAQKLKHDAQKVALGLPRKIHGPREDGPIMSKAGPMQTAWQPPEWLDCRMRDAKTPKKDVRYGSPVHIHVARAASGLLLRVIAFPAMYLPDFNRSRTVLQGFIACFEQRVKELLQEVKRGGTIPTRSYVPPAGRGPSKRVHGTRAMVKIIEARPKGGFVVQEEGRPQGVLTLGTAPSPPPEPGSSVTVFVHDDDPARPQYRWDDPNAARRKDVKKPGR